MSTFARTPFLFYPRTHPTPCCCPAQDTVQVLLGPGGEVLVVANPRQHTALNGARGVLGRLVGQLGGDVDASSGVMFATGPVGKPEEVHSALTAASE